MYARFQVQAAGTPRNEVEHADEREQGHEQDQRHERQVDLVDVHVADDEGAQGEHRRVEEDARLVEAESDGVAAGHYVEQEDDQQFQRQLGLVVLDGVREVSGGKAVLGLFLVGLVGVQGL